MKAYRAAAFAAVLGSAVACSAETGDPFTPRVAMDGLSPLGEKGCNKHVNCDDRNACTTDVYVRGRGCVHTPVAPTPPGYSFSEVTVPGAYATYATAINARGDVGGLYQLGAADDYAVHGFVLHAGTFASIDRPGARETYINALADDGRVLGYTSSSDAQHPFVFENGAFTPIGALDNGLYIPVGWNGAGDIVGVVGQTGFTWIGGVLSQVSRPGEDITGLTGIADNGDAVGYTFTTDPTSGASASRSFLLRGGAYTDIAVPGAAETYAYGIHGTTIVGHYRTPDSWNHGFVMVAGAFSTFDVPGTSYTTAFGVNASGQVVGSFTGTDGNSRGYVGTPTAGACTP
jgi:hypothetical protein